MQTKLIHKCRICGHQFQATAFDIPIIGEPTPERLQKLGGALMGHLSQKHPQEFGMLMAAQQNVLYFLVAQMFEFSDPVLLKMADDVRSETHRRTRRHWLEDHQLEELARNIVDEWAKNASYAEQVRNVVLILRNLRNLIGEEPIPEDPTQIARPA